MHTKLPVLAGFTFFSIVFLTAAPLAHASQFRLTLPQIILRELQSLRYPLPSQISNVIITASIVKPRPKADQPLAETLTPASTNTPSLDDVQKYIMNGINQYRASRGLSPVQPGSETCNFAKTRAKEISNGFTHDGFTQRVNNHTLPYARWTKVTENIAETPSYKDVVNMWANSPGHAANMRAGTPYVCVAEYQNFYAYEGMNP